MSIFSSSPSGGALVPGNLTISGPPAVRPSSPQDNDTHFVTDDGTSTGLVLEIWKFDADTLPSGQWIGVPIDTDISLVDLVLGGVDGDDLTLNVTEDGVVQTDTIDLTPILTSLTYGAVLGAPSVAGRQDNDTHFVTDDGLITGNVIEVWKFDEQAGAWAALPSGGGHWNIAGTSLASTNNANAVYTQDYVGVNGPANMTPLAPLQIANNVSDAGGGTDFNSTVQGAAQFDGFDQWSEYQALLYQGATPQTSYGTGIESGSIVDNVGSTSTTAWRAFRFGGVPKFGIRGDGWLRAFDYGRNLKNNGTVSSVLVSSSEGFIRERPASDGSPSAVQPLYGGNWLWGGWSPIYTTNTGYVDEGWSTAFTFTAPQLAPGFTGRSWTMEMNGNFGQKLNYQRECITREIYGWRILVNGANFGTRANAIVHYQDERRNPGNEATNKYLYKPIGDWHWTRGGIAPGATIVIQYQHRHQVTGVQANAYARFISGVYRELNVRFSSNIAIAY